MILNFKEQLRLRLFELAIIKPNLFYGITNIYIDK